MQEGDVEERQRALILALNEDVREESIVEIILEGVPVGDHQVKRRWGNAVKNAQGQFRVIKDASETLLERRIYMGR